MTNSNRRQLARVRNAFLGATALAGFAAVATPASAIVINDNYTPTQAVDTTNVTGVGQMVVDLQNGFIGLCTATLINPRVVLFASHCVNENPQGNGFESATGYGAANGGLPIGFFFNVNNNVSGNSSIGQWLNGISGGPKDLTRTGNNAYNSNFVVYNTNCCTLSVGNNFLQSDIAMAGLDTPAIGIPTFTTLFSVLSGPAHATITGYGDKGIGSTGQGTIDFKRRVAENIVSVLGSLDSQDEALERFCVANGFGCGVGPDGLPANLYMLDFNDPNGTNVYDFNIFNDTALTREGITAPGDSGGPLIIDTTFSAPTIAAVLSGGDRFYLSQPGSSYGTTSFYQPLYLYWDWILANNPYKYVTNTGGNHNWDDANAFMMKLDPGYMTIDGSGHLVNALPTTPAIGQVAAPGFGEVCYLDDCIDISSGTGLTAPIVTPRPAQTTPSTGSRPFGGVLGQAGFDSLVASFVASLSTPGGSGPAIVDASTIDGYSGPDAGSGSGGTPSNLVTSAQSNWINPEGTALVNGVAVQGAPGASPGQLVTDTNANVATLNPARYYDVTLAADGITTIQGSGAYKDITVDMLTINGPATGLTISSGGSLTTLINTNVFAGTLNVNGTYNAPNGIAMFGGMMTGTGTVNGSVAFLIGAVGPGTNGTIGTLSINGSVNLGLGSSTLVDVTNATTDLLAITGPATVGGTLVVHPLSAPTLADSHTFLTATGGISGAYNAVPDTIAGVLYPVVTKVTVSGVDTEVLTFQVGSFVSQLSPGTPDALTLAAGLDAAYAGGHYNDMKGLFDALFPLSDGALDQALENLAPDSERAATLVGDMQTTGLDNMLWQQLGGMGAGAAGDGQSAGLHIDSDGLKSALNSATGVSAESQQFIALGANIATNPGGGNDVIPTTGTAAAASPTAAGDSWMMLPNGAGGFLSGSSLNGTVAIGGGGGKADVRGLIIGAGIDFPVADGLTVGGSLGYSDASATLRSAPATLQSDTFQGALYARYDFGNHYMAEAFAAYAGQSIETRRIAIVGPIAFAMRGHSGGSSPSFGASIGKSLVANTLGGMTINLVPSFGLQYISSSIDAFTETGGPAAMTFAGFNEHSILARIGFDANTTFDLGTVRVTPNTHAFWVNSFGNNGSIQAAFAAAPSSVMTFAMAAKDHSYAEVGLGADFDLGEVFGKDAKLSGRYDATLDRKDIGYGAWTGRLSIKF